MSDKKTGFVVVDQVTGFCWTGKGWSKDTTQADVFSSEWAADAATHGLTGNGAVPVVRAVAGD